MDMRVLLRETRLSVPPDEVFAWHVRPGALERLIPPWSGVRVTSRRGDVMTGGEVALSIPVGPLRLRWVARHEGVIAGREFADVQEQGPFRYWRHVHRVLPAAGSSQLEDQIEYALPRGAGWMRGYIESELDKTFAFRHRRLRDDLARHATATRTMTIAVSGGSGLIGAQLIPFLSGGGHAVQRLVRGPTRPDSGMIAWNPGQELDTAALSACDAVVHLAGRTVAERWTTTAKAAIRDSRIVATRHLCEALARQAQRPRVLVCASAIGIYGDTGDHAVKEGASAGDGFLAEVCREWEAACDPARQAGIRVVNLRFGVVLGAAGGALAKLRLPARCGVAGPVGGGRQWMSWIALDDALGVIHHALCADDLEGAVNAVAPEPVTNRDFMRTLGRVCHRPAVMPVPAALIDAMFGDMGRATLLASQRVLPARLLGRGFPFRHPDLAETMRFELGYT